MYGNIYLKVVGTDRSGPVKITATALIWTEFWLDRDSLNRAHLASAVRAVPQPEELHFYSVTDTEPIARAVAFREGFEAWAMRIDSTEKLYTGKPVVAAYAMARDLPMIKQAFKARAVERLITAIDGEGFTPFLLPLHIATHALEA